MAASRGAVTVSRYRAITHLTFKACMQRLGYVEVRLPGVPDFVYERVIDNGPFPSSRFKVRIFSSVHIMTKTTREVGDDAIRVILLDTKLNLQIKDWRVYRTTNALDNVALRARDAWDYVMAADHHCPACGAMMVERQKHHTGRAFLVCTAEPDCPAARTSTQGSLFARM